MEVKKTNSLTYRDAGVDIKAGDALVRAIGPVAERTRRAGLIGTIGGFGGLFDLKEAGFKDPVLVSATDGVGTKLKLAQKLGRHRGLGIDLVAMCVNDLLAQGAEPLFFLDYFATGRLHPSIAEQVIEGIADGCVLAGCALIGGETAEMPGVYDEAVYDLAGFAVGAVERENILPKPDITPSDILLAMPSSGLHSNGFSLVRKVVADIGPDLSGPCPYETGITLGDSLLTPTRIYVKPLLGPIHAGKVKALAHITGGGLTANIPRILPKTCAAAIDLDNWEAPGVFTWLSKIAGIEESEMLHTFNCGIGMVIVASPDAVPLLRSSLADKGEQVIEIGNIIAAEAKQPDRVVYSGHLF